MEKPIVSICCITYNHEKFIAECIEGFLMQKTTFPIEILIFDDASNDGTQVTVQKYASKDIRIKTFLQTENQWSQQKYGLIDWLFPHAQGKYIALCEGDDYWTDPLKLQKQVDFLEANEDYVLCFHNVKININEKLEQDNITKKVNETTTILDLACGNYIHTPSCVFRNNIKSIQLTNFNKITAGDYYLHMLNARCGKIKKLNDTMAVYRVHQGGIHSNKPQIKKNLEWVEQLLVMRDLFTYEVKVIFDDVITKIYNNIIEENSNDFKHKYQAEKFKHKLLEIQLNEIKKSYQDLNFKQSSFKYLLNQILNTTKKRLLH